MGQMVEIVTPLHTATQRDCIGRMLDNKVEAMIKAKEYEYEYWDGDRRYGYGGYKYMPGRWKPVAEALIERYDLKAGSKVLDVGCGKGFLLYEMQLIEPGLELYGFDISDHGLETRHPSLNATVHKQRAEEPFPWESKYFDLVISLGTFHNLHLPELEKAIMEVERTAKNSYVMVESFRNEQEMFNLECWALTAETILSVKAWEWLYRKLEFSGDYEFIYF
jgi:ubiquinone/menaquinone biosynthesis C-methylase UbiE